MKLTVPQVDWLVALYNYGDITRYGSNGNKPLRRLIELGLVRAVNSSYPGLDKKYLPMFSYMLTSEGNIYCKRNQNKFREAGYIC